MQNVGEGRVVGGLSWRSLAKWSAVSAVVLLLCTLALLTANAAAPEGALVAASEVTAALALVLGLVAAASGLAHFATSRPDLRRPLLFLLAVTLVVFAAHMYIIDSPPAFTAGSVSGSVGGSFNDSALSISSELRGSTLTVNVTDVGSNAVGRLSLYFDNASLPASGLSPEVTPDDPLQPSSSSGLGFPTSATGTWTVGATSGSSTLTADYETLTCYHVPQPGDAEGLYGCIMDETYYVPAAMAILSGEHCAPFQDACNLEHPPLAKVLIAGGIAVFGMGDFGWRISSVVAGTLSIPLLFVLMYLLSGDRRLSYFATLIFAADILFFVHSSAALLDVPPVFFTLLAFILYFKPCGLWKMDNYMASGILLGLALLCKETAVFAIAAIVSFELLFEGVSLRESFVRTAEVAIPALLVFAGGLQVYGSLFTPASLPWFYQRIAFILSYGSGLKGPGWCLYASPCPNGPYITPLNWLLYYEPVAYLVIGVTVSSAASVVTYASVAYYGVSNQLIVWMTFFWVPVAAYPLVKGKWGLALTRDERVGALLVTWFLWSYLPYIALWLYGRVTYPFYILPAGPALAAGAAFFVTRPWFPRKVALLYLAGAFLLFFIYFPVKDFLPVYLRALIAR